MSAKTVGEMITDGNIPSTLKSFGEDINSILRESKIWITGFNP